MLPGAPVGPVAWVCLVLALLCLLPAVNRRLAHAVFDTTQRVYTIGITTLSFALSLGYVHVYLGGGPRIIDATSYFLQAKIFAAGEFAFRAPGALHSFAGRFLVVTPDGELAVLFPPGYAALLALGVKLGIPLVINPATGSLLTLLTYRLGAREFSERSGRIAGLLSALCACLRYHSADTMSHTWTATLVLAIVLCVTSERPGKPYLALLAGLCAGWLFATRPLTGVVVGGVGFGLVCVRARISDWKPTLLYLAGTVPGLGLWWFYQWVTTGSPWLTTQAVYYAHSDWPQACFRLGLGTTIGCRFEHGDFLDTYQPEGFRLLQALQVTARRLWQHQRDITNMPWLSFFLVLALTPRALARRKAALLLSLVALHIALYAFFYFDGNYPGGGARLFVDVMPLEHVLLGSVLRQLRLERWLPSVSLLGFALWGGAEHHTLATRDGGRPMFEQATLHRAGGSKGLVFVTTDHGFNLGFDPSAASDSTGVPQVARLRNDAFDFATWVHLGKPPAFVYRFDPTATHGARSESIPWQPPNRMTFNGRSLWPLPVVSGATIPVHNPDGLRLLPWVHHTLQGTIELPISYADNYALELEVVSSPSTLVVAGWSSASERPLNNTTILSFSPRFLEAGETSLVIRSNSEITLVSVTLARIVENRPAATPPP